MVMVLAPRFGAPALSSTRPTSRQSTPACWQNRLSSAVSTAWAREGGICPISTQSTSIPAPPTQRHTINAETGGLTKPNRTIKKPTRAASIANPLNVRVTMRFIASLVRIAEHEMLKPSF